MFLDILGPTGLAPLCDLGKVVVGFQFPLL